jgi:hypothetical protein
MLERDTHRNAGGETTDNAAKAKTHAGIHNRGSKTQRTWNMAAMFVTWPVFQPPMGWLKSEASCGKMDG